MLWKCSVVNVFVMQAWGTNLGSPELIKKTGIVMFFFGPSYIEQSQLNPWSTHQLIILATGWPCEPLRDPASEYTGEGIEENTWCPSVAYATVAWVHVLIDSHKQRVHIYTYHKREILWICFMWTILMCYNFTSFENKKYVDRFIN